MLRVQPSSSTCFWEPRMPCNARPSEALPYVSDLKWKILSLLQYSSRFGHLRVYNWRRVPTSSSGCKWLSIRYVTRAWKDAEPRCWRFRLGKLIRLSAMPKPQHIYGRNPLTMNDFCNNLIICFSLIYTNEEVMTNGVESFVGPSCNNYVKAWSLDKDEVH